MVVFLSVALETEQLQVIVFAITAFRKRHYMMHMEPLAIARILLPALLAGVVHHFLVAVRNLRPILGIQVL